jgi:hypothetical protein
MLFAYLVGKESNPALLAMRHHWMDAATVMGGGWPCPWVFEWTEIESSLTQ